MRTVPKSAGSTRSKPLDLTRLKCLEARGVVPDWTEDHAGQLGLRAPGRRIAFELEAVSTCHDLRRYGPVPTGFRVANVPSGRNVPVESTVPASALYFRSAVGLDQFGMIAFRNDAGSGAAEPSCTVVLFTARQLR